MKTSTKKASASRKPLDKSDIQLGILLFFRSFLLIIIFGILSGRLASLLLGLIGDGAASPVLSGIVNIASLSLAVYVAAYWLRRVHVIKRPAKVSMVNTILLALLYAVIIASLGSAGILNVDIIGALQRQPSQTVGLLLGITLTLGVYYFVGKYSLARQSQSLFR